MFKDLMASPHDLEEAVRKNEQFDRADQLSFAIAKMMGGPCCVNQLQMDSFSSFFESNVLPKSNVPEERRRMMVLRNYDGDDDDDDDDGGDDDNAATDDDDDDDDADDDDAIPAFVFVPDHMTTGPWTADT